MEVDEMSSESARAEAVALLTGSGVDPQRGQLHKSVLERRTRGGAGVGIAGGEVCQACGAVEAFAGLAAAMLKHRRSDYLCNSCLRELSGKSTGTYGAVEMGRIEEEMSRRPHRFCEVCRAEVLPSAATRLRLHCLVCARCHSQLEEIDSDVEALLRDLGKLRYLELRHPTAASLSEYDKFNAWQRAELDTRSSGAKS
jgi:hypothetical protein